MRQRQLEIALLNLDRGAGPALVHALRSVAAAQAKQHLTPPLRSKPKRKEDVFTKAWDTAWATPTVVIETKATPGPPPDPRLVRVLQKRDSWITATSADFQTALEPIIRKAQRQLLAYLQANLQMRNGVALNTQQNVALLSTVDDLYMQFLDAAGYTDLVKKFTSGFVVQIPFLQDTIDYTAKVSGHTLPAVSFSPDELNVLTSNAAVDLTSTMKSVGTAAIGRITAERALFGLAGLPFKRVVEIFQDEFGGSAKRNAMRAETAISVWYRQINDLQFQTIERALPGIQQAFVYLGPRDSRNRPFCRKVLDMTAKKPLTRAEIDKLDNGTSLMPVWTGCGGWGCRHTWGLWIPKKKAA